MRVVGLFSPVAHKSSVRGSTHGTGLRSAADCCPYNGRELTRGASMLLKRYPLKAKAPRLSPASLPRHA